MNDITKSEEILTIKGRAYLVLDGYLAVPIDVLRERYLRRYNAARKEGKVLTVRRTVRCVFEEEDGGGGA